MAEVNTDIYKNVAAPQNPLTSMGAVVGISNALNQNRLANSTFAARDAIGKAYSGAIDPETGVLDSNKLLASVAKDPNAAFMAGDVAKQAQDREAQQLQIGLHNYELHSKQLDRLNNGLGTLLARGAGNIAPEDYQNNVIQALKNKTISPTQATAALQELAAAGGDRNKIDQIVRDKYLMTLQAKEKMDAIYGQIQPMDVGGRILQVQTPGMPSAGGPIIRGEATKSLTPGEATTPTPMLSRNPDGTMTPSTVTRQQFANAANQGPVATAPSLSPHGLTPDQANAEVTYFDPVTKQNVKTTMGNYLTTLGVPPQGGGAAAPAAAAPGNAPTTGRYPVNPAATLGAPGSAFTAPPDQPGASLQPGAPAPAASPAAAAPAAAPRAAGPATPPGTVAAGPAMGSAAAADVSARSAAEQGVALNKRADVVPEMKGLLGNMEGLVKSGDFNPGPGAEAWKDTLAGFNRVAEGLGIPALTINSKGVASQEEFSKLALQVAQAQFRALGGTGTDQQLGSASHTSPNATLSKLGNTGIIALLKGNEDALATKNREWQAYQEAGNGPESYAKFSTEFNKAYDPRVFQSAYLDDAAKKKMIDGMTKAEQSAFKQSYFTAVQKGWIPDPRAPNG